MTTIQHKDTDKSNSAIANDILNILSDIDSIKPSLKTVSNGFEVNLTNEWKRSPSYNNSYEDEWFRLFQSSNISFESIQSLGLTGELRNCRFRSVCWRIYLDVISVNSSNWLNEIDSHRKLYIALRNQYVIDPRSPELPTSTANHINLVTDDPLSLQDESNWNKYFKSQDIMKEIKQDVVRTFPEIEFFHSTSVRTSMINVLYCYSQTSKLFYRQGMHEILAPLIFVLHCDHMAFEHSLELSNLSGAMRDIGSVLLDSSFLEHDAYSIFSRVMSIIESWYDVNPIGISNKSMLFDPPKPFEKPREYVPECSVTQRLHHIHDNILKRQDLDLYLHLEHLEIAPQMFGLRWLKLLFGREYTMQDLLMVWDVLFAVDRHFSLVDHIYVSMLVHIRDYLLVSDFATCITQLMRYPTNVDVNQIIDYALFLYDPISYQKPKETTQYHRGLSSFPVISSSPLSSSSLKKKRAQRNKTIVGIEIFANRLSNLITKRQPAIESYINQERPAQLSYRQKIPSISDSAPVTPTNNVAQSEASAQSCSPQIDVTDYLDVNIYNQSANEDSESLMKIISICSKLVSQAITDVSSHIHLEKTSDSLDKALAALKQTRDILSGNLTLNRRRLITELQYDRPSNIKRKNSPQMPSLNRSVSNNDISSLRNTNGNNSTEIDFSEKLMRFFPHYHQNNNTVELQGINKN